MVQLLKRNHDILLGKYELFRQTNESLEKMAVEKESLYNEMKIDLDKATQKLFRTQKSLEENLNQNEVYSLKVKTLEEAQKSRDETIKTLKFQKEKFEGHSKVAAEQLEVVQGSHEELSSKKAKEVDLLSKEIT